jgi:DNA-binding Lrp family transcriptional regulator
VKKVEGVEEAYISYGVYDLAVKVRADSMDALKDIISNRLRQIKKVRSTISLLLIEE